MSELMHVVMIQQGDSDLIRFRADPQTYHVIHQVWECRRLLKSNACGSFEKLEDAERRKREVEQEYE